MTKENVVVVKRVSAKMMEKYKANIGVREDFVEFNVRGSKAAKIAEYAEVVKYLSVNDATKSFQISKHDFDKAYGGGAEGHQLRQELSQEVRYPSTSRCGQYGACAYLVERSN